MRARQGGREREKGGEKGDEERGESLIGCENLTNVDCRLTADNLRCERRQLFNVLNAERREKEEKEQPSESDGITKRERESRE
jgi:hypothetical protein